jgi:hypothetical protein
MEKPGRKRTIFQPNPVFFFRLLMPILEDLFSRREGPGPFPFPGGPGPGESNAESYFSDAT